MAPAGVILGGRATQLGLECPLVQQGLALEQRKDGDGSWLGPWAYRVGFHPPPLGSTPHAVGHQSGVAEASVPVDTATMGSGKLLAAPTVPVLVHTPEGNGGDGDFPSCQALGSVARMT